MGITRINKVVTGNIFKKFRRNAILRSKPKKWLSLLTVSF